MKNWVSAQFFIVLKPKKMKFILAKKLKMTEVFDEEGNLKPVTVLLAGPNFITQIKTKEKDGYNALQVGFDLAKKNNKPKRGHLSKIKIPGFDASRLRYLKEFRLKEDELKKMEDYQLGAKIDVSIFQPGEKVKVEGISKGKGFAGVVKRHGFAGMNKTHGDKDRWRAPGSIGATHPQHVIKGRKMAGRMGSDKVTIKNLKIFAVEPENNLLILEGAVPGRPGSLIKITSV